jgi:hypothetical protein
VTGRFVNPHLIWPIPPTGDRIKKDLNPKRQSGRSKDTIAPARGVAQRVHVPKGGSHPVDDAKSTIGTMSTTASGTVVSTIEGVTDSIMSVVSAISPLAELAGLFLDKPQMPDEASRMFIAPATNFVGCDVRDQAYSMALYKTSYMGVNTNTLPESSDVSWLAIAMRPALQFTGFLNNTLNVHDYPSHPTTTPFGWAISSHLYWRGSIRYRINFYASTFVSGRVLIVYSPPTSAAVTTINNTISRIIAVKGDTTVEFTIPFVSNTDFQPLGYPQSGGFTFYGSGQLTFSVYGNIISSDASTDAVIDYAVWTAAAPDAQFMQPLVSSLYGLAPDTVSKQSDICEAFNKVFPPFVDGCEYLTDTGYVASEVSRSPMDVLKRYQVFDTNIAPNSKLPGLYTPQGNTLGWQIKTAFLFMRGGVNYKVFPALSTQSTYVDPVNYAAAKWSIDPSWPYYVSGSATGNATGLPYLTAGASNSEIDVSVPYTNQFPFVFTNTMNPSSAPAEVLITPRQNPLQWSTDPTPIPIYLGGMDVYTCVRDDFMMGWLLAPSTYPEGGSKSGLKPDSQFRAKTIRSSALKPHKKQLSILDFYM